jgi:hypothetical protein
MAMRAAVVVMLVLLIATPASGKRPSAPASSAARLIGTWSIDPTDEAGIKAFGRCAMEFKPNGQLVHSVPEGEMFLTYRVEGDVLITDQPSHPREQRTRFWFTSDGSLVLDLDGQRARFLKQAPSGH